MTGSLLDVCLALLLVSAAAVTLVDANARHDRHARQNVDRAGETATVLASTTAAVPYTLGTGTDEASPAADRVAHRTLAEHLAVAAVRSATLDGRALSPGVADYRRAVRDVVADALGPRTNVSVVWTPLHGTGIAGSVGVGAAPPETTDVHAARFTVPVGGATVDRATPEATLVAVLFPPDRIAATVRDDGTAPSLVRERYRRAGAVLGVDAARALDAGGPRAANDLLVAALADRRDDGTAASAGRAENAETDENARLRRVVVVVRTWEP